MMYRCPWGYRGIYSHPGGEDSATVPVADSIFAPTSVLAMLPLYFSSHFFCPSLGCFFGCFLYLSSLFQEVPPLTIDGGRYFQELTDNYN